MPYYTDTVASFTLLKSTIESYCVVNGWTLSDDILSKDSCFFKLVADTTNYLALQGGLSQIGSTLNGQPGTPSKGSNYVRIANYPSFEATSFPITYHLFIFNNPIEVYCFIEYNSGYFQHLAFGKSNLSGIGLGAWFSASSNGDSNQNTSTWLSSLSVSITDIAFCTSGNLTTAGTPTAGLFVGRGVNSTYCFPSTFIYTDLDSKGWIYWSKGLYLSTSIMAGLLTALPNLSNQATVLLPIKSVLSRSSGGLNILANLINARLLRIDNHESKAIIAFGSEQWMVFPWYRRDVVNRNGQLNTTHSGTFGFAIRYEV